MYIRMRVMRITYPLDDIISCSFSLLRSIKVTMQTKELYVQVKKLIRVKAFSSFIFKFTFHFLLATIDICVNFQCNHGACQKDRSNQPYCSCHEGYGGSRCETQIGMFKEKEYIYI
jgi:hypothetical protein